MTELMATDTPYPETDEVPDRKPLTPGPRRWAPFLAIPVIGVVWLVLSARSELVASPQGAFGETLDGVREGWLRTALMSTMKSVIVGFAAAFAFALVVAAVLASSRFLRRVFDPLLAAYGAVPRVVFFPALLSIFGLGGSSKEAMGFLSAVYPLIVTVTAGIVSIPPILKRLSDSLRLRRWNRFRLVTVPAAMPSVILAARLGLSIALISVVVSEYFAGRDGLGVILSESYARLNVDRMYAVVLTIAMIATIANVGLWALERRLRR